MKSQLTDAKQSVAVKIADDIRVQIESGGLQPGDAIPTLKDLAERWHCAVGTVREAQRLLKDQGLVTSARGRPLTVRRPPPRIVRSSTRHQIEKDLARKPYEERAKLGTAELETDISFDELDHIATYERFPVGAELAEAFRVEPGTEVLQRIFETVRRADGSRNAWSVSYIPVEIFAPNPDFLDQEKEPWAGGTQWQLSTLGIEIEAMREIVTSRMPTTPELGAWSLEPGTPLFNLRRISIDTEGRVVEVSDAIFPGDRTTLEFVTHLERW